MRAFFTGSLLAILSGITTLGSAQAGPPSACLVASTQVTPTDMQPILDALRIESRKANLLWTWRLTPDEASCAPDAPRVTLSKTGVMVRLAPESLHGFALWGQTPEVRAQMIGRSVIEIIIAQETTGEAQVPLLARDDDLSLGGPPELGPSGPTTEALSPPASSSPQFSVFAGGHILHQFAGEGTAVEEGRLLAGPLLEVSLSWFDEHLAIALQGSAYWATTVEDTALSVDSHGGDLLIMGRGGLRMGDVYLSLGGGLGFQHRVVTLSTLSERDASIASATSNVGLGALELGVVWRLSRLIAVSGRLTGRLYFAGPEHQWFGETVYGASAGALGGQIAFGVTP